MMFIFVFVYDACAMAEGKTGWIRLVCESQTASVQRERDIARTTSP